MRLAGRLGTEEPGGPRSKGSQGSRPHSSPGSALAMTCMSSALCPALPSTAFYVCCLPPTQWSAHHSLLDCQEGPRHTCAGHTGSLSRNRPWCHSPRQCDIKDSCFRSRGEEGKPTARQEEVQDEASSLHVPAELPRPQGASPVTTTVRKGHCQSRKRTRRPGESGPHPVNRKTSGGPSDCLPASSVTLRAPLACCIQFLQQCHTCFKDVGGMQ